MPQWMRTKTKMKIELFQKIALSYLNIPYIYGGKNPLKGEDCSGLTCEILKALGALKTNEEFGSQELYTKYIPTGIRGEIGPGSLVFYGKGVTSIDHVALFIDDHFILEAGHGTAETLTKEIATERGAYSRIRPYTYRADLVDILKIELGLVA